jgi:hypothetical protein
VYLYADGRINGNVPSPRNISHRDPAPALPFVVAGGICLADLPASLQPPISHESAQLLLNT